MTTNNAVVVIAAVIAISWAWASVGVVQRNFELQKEIDDKLRTKRLVELETQNLAYEQQYYKSGEYLSLEVKKRLGLAEPGEKVLILPPNSPSVKSEDGGEAQSVTPGQDTQASEPTNAQQWMNFLFGGNNNNT